MSESTLAAGGGSTVADPVLGDVEGTTATALARGSAFNVIYATDRLMFAKYDAGMKAKRAGLDPLVGIQRWSDFLSDDEEEERGGTYRRSTPSPRPGAR